MGDISTRQALQERVVPSQVLALLAAGLPASYLADLYPNMYQQVQVALLADIAGERRTRTEVQDLFRRMHAEMERVDIWHHQLSKVLDERDRLGGLLKVDDVAEALGAEVIVREHRGMRLPVLAYLDVAELLGLVTCWVTYPDETSFRGRHFAAICEQAGAVYLGLCNPVAII